MMQLLGTRFGSCLLMGMLGSTQLKDSSRDLRARADYQDPDVRPIIDRACQLMRPEMMVCAGCGSDDTRRRSTYVAECNVCEGLTSIDCEDEVVFRSAKSVRAAQAEFEAQDRDMGERQEYFDYSF